MITVTSMYVYQGATYGLIYLSLKTCTYSNQAKNILTKTLQKDIVHVPVNMLAVWMYFYLYWNSN